MTSVPVRSTCCYCGVGCGIVVSRRNDGKLVLEGDRDHPGSRGELCSKGRTLLHTVAAREQRLLWPELRLERQAPRRRVGWDEAIAHVARRFAAIIAAHGPDSVAFYISGQCLTEEYYLANKLVKGFLGTNNVDTNSRLCMSSAVAGYKATLGADSVPVCYDDLDHADTFLIAGANPAWAHPIVFKRIEARKAADPDRVRLICVDPRRTATATASDLHLPIRPGTDVALFHGIAAHLLAKGHTDEQFIAAHTTGFAALGMELSEWSPARAAAICGVPEADIVQAAEWLGGDRRFLSLWTMGLNQSAVGVDKNVALINLSLLTGKIGRPGCGPFSLTGQPNAMGGREVGGLANLLPAHRNLADPAHRAEVAAFWGVKTLRDQPGLTAVEQLQAAQDGRLKALWVICTNPAASLPDRHAVEAGFANLDLLVVQDIFPTETTALADVVLPAATWLEKTGTMTSSERRVTLLEAAVAPPGEALPDNEILLRFARAMGFGAAFAFADTEAIWREHAALTKGRDCDVSGIDYALLRVRHGVQWPCPAPDAPAVPRLYEDHRFAFADGKARFAAPAFLQRSEVADAAYPLVLDTGRIRDQWHYGSRSGRVVRLGEHTPSPRLTIHPDDATTRGIRDGDIVEVTGRRGRLRLRAEVTVDIRPGVVYAPMHWSRGNAGELGAVNTLTSPILDPISKEPDLKYAAVQVTALRPPARRILVIGGGAAALAFVEQHQRLAEGGRILNDQICILGAEPEAIYNRVLLPHYIDGGKSWDDLVRGGADTLAAQGVTFTSGRRALRIDRATRTVTDDAGVVHGYDLLVLATGSRPNRPTSGPLAKPGALGLRGRDDAELIKARVAAVARTRTPLVVIQGAGLLGIELADALARLGCAVTILQRSKRLMGKQLDAPAAAMLLAHLQERGIAVRFDAQPSALLGDDQVSGVRLDDGVELACDLFVFATGTTANSELAKSAGLPCAAGITVDEHLMTVDPHIAAIGECAEWRDRRVGTTAGAEAQAAHLVEFLRGNVHAPWKGWTESNILKVEGLALASCGLTDEEGLPDIEVARFSDPAAGVYHKALIRQDRLIGVIMAGDTSGFAAHRDLIAAGGELDALRSKVLRLGGGSGPKGRLVCACNQVGVDDLKECIRQGARDLSTLCAKSRAGTACGSCRGDVRAVLALGS